MTDWLMAVKLSLDENLVIYNSRSHKTMQATQAQSQRALKGNLRAFTYHPMAVQLHGPTLFKSALSAGREIIYDGTYTWEEK